MNPNSSIQRSASTSFPDLRAAEGILAECLAIVFMVAISWTADFSGYALVFFPELAALSYGVFRRPLGAWALAPWMLAVTPAATATIGLLVARSLPFGYASVLIAVVSCVALVMALRSPIAPAISAGLLPVVLQVESWLYPPCILFGTTLLVLTLQFWRSRVGKQVPTGQPTSREKIEDAVEACPRRRKWLPVYFVFVVAVALVAQASGLRMILFPPLIVIAFEMFGHPTICPWAKRPIQMVVACSLAAACGTAAAYWLGAGVISTAIGLVCGILVLRVTDLHLPPALAVALIPQILPSLDYRYPLSVLLGTSILSIAFQLYRRYLHRPASRRLSALEP